MAIICPLDNGKGESAKYSVKESHGKEQRTW